MERERQAGLPALASGGPAASIEAEEATPPGHEREQLCETQTDISEPRTIGAPWSYDFLFDATEDGRRLKWMPILDEYTRECLALEVDRSMTSTDVLMRIDQLIAERGAPAFIRSDNGPEFIAEAVRQHLIDRKVETRFIAPGAPWENGYLESFNGTLREELLSREVFGHLLEAKVLGEQYRQEYNTERPHSSLDYQTPAEYAASYVAGSALTTAPA